MSSKNSLLLISNGRVIDPSRGIDEVTDDFVEDGIIKSIGQSFASGSIQTIDASGMVVAPGFIDVHVHLREPGNEEAETILSGLRSAVTGGLTSVVSMANTTPPTDSAASIESALARAREVNLARLLPAGAATQGRRGEAISDMAGMADAGAVAFSDDGDFVRDAGLMKKVLERAAALHKPVLSHCEDPSLALGAVMHEGTVSAALGLPGMPSAAEDEAAKRDIKLAEVSGAQLHIMHVSTAGTVEQVRLAKKRGARVTAEATPHHFALTEKDVRGDDPNYKMNPPLRSMADVEAVKQGIADGTIDCIASDHAPHTAKAKKKVFKEAPFGIIGMESLLPITLTELVHGGIISLTRAVECLTSGPARALGLNAGTLAEGAPADITIFDPDEQWQINPNRFESAGRNCPFGGRMVRGRIKYSIVGGEVKFPF